MEYGQSLVLGDFPRATQVCQLSLAIQPHSLVLVLVWENANARFDQLQSLVRVSQWLAKETGARVLLLLPLGIADRPQLERILYAAYGLSHLSVERTANVTRSASPSAWLLPIKGRPHPLSEGERLLAGLLLEDPELTGLFQFNVSVTTVRNHRYLVDLVWVDGGLVVEVDGYCFHSNQFAFRQDRHRDYELTLSGFRVLRLTHEEIMEDAELAVDKIRDLVRLINALKNGNR
jgi:very-short-patch-repair endonuclease